MSSIKRRASTLTTRMSLGCSDRCNNYFPISLIQDMTYQGRTIKKVMGGRGIFEPQEFCFVIKFLVGIFFRPKHEYFLGLIGVHEFFSFNFPLREYFFWYSPLPNKFANGPSLMSLRQQLNGFRNLAKLASWSYSAQVKDRKAPSDPSWPRFCCLRCFFDFVLEIVLFQMRPLTAEIINIINNN